MSHHQSEINEQLELVDLQTERVLGVATRLASGEVLVDQATHPYAVVAEVRGVDLWTHLKGVANGYVAMRAVSSHPHRTD